ncbi:MAG TPA: glycosyltransferase family 39 protein [Candidatus Binatia bacterium]|jgi:4-amino-4-deoxy-L-arabinose transferase-like glycosyltransferase
MKNTSRAQTALNAVAIDLLGENAGRLRDIAILAAFCFILLFFALGELPFFTRGEPREGLVVWEMYSSGNWILPAVNGDYIPFKPPLFHWLALLVSYVFGRVDEFTLRFPSALLATAGVLLTYRVAARLWGRTAAIVSGVVLVTCSEWWQAGTETQVDMTLAFFVSAACLYFDFLYHERDFGLVTALGLPFILGLATLAKGPLGLVLPGLIFLGYLSLRRDFTFIQKLYPLQGALVFLATAGSWYAAAVWQGGPAFFLRQIVDENLRTAAGTYGHYQPIYYYLPVFLENTLPWSLFIPCIALFLYQRRGRLEDERLLFPCVWLFSVLIFFSASLGKRGVYILPLYPAFALLFGAWWQQIGEGKSRAVSIARWLTGAFIAASVAATFGVALYYAAEHGLIDPKYVAGLTTSKNTARVLAFLTEASPFKGLWLGLYLAALCGLLWALFRRNWRFTFAALSLITLAVSSLINSFVYSAMASERTMKPFVMRVNQRIAADKSLLFYRDTDYGVMFYARRHIPAYAAKVAQLQPPFFLLIWEDDLNDLGVRPDLKTIDVSEGLGPAGRHRLALVKYQPSASIAEPLPVYCPRSGARINPGEQCTSIEDAD